MILLQTNQRQKAIEQAGQLSEEEISGCERVLMLRANPNMQVVMLCNNSLRYSTLNTNAHWYFKKKNTAEKKSSKFPTI